VGKSTGKKETAKKVTQPLLKPGSEKRKRWKRRRTNQDSNHKVRKYYVECLDVAERKEAKFARKNCYKKGTRKSRRDKKNAHELCVSSREGQVADKKRPMYLAM